MRNTRKPYEFIDKKKNLSFNNIWFRELIAGFQVALIALPLCLGISVASGFPPVAGIITAIIGGVLVSRFSGSNVTINGPAAGLIVVVLAGVETLGQGDMAAGYRYTLAATVCAGVLQILFGMLRMGRLRVLFPHAAVHGMMAAIGLIILGKQLPVLLGSPTAPKSIFQIFTHLPDLILTANPLIALTGIAGLVLLLVIPKIKQTWVKAIPAPVWVVAFGALLGHLLGLNEAVAYSFLGKSYELGPQNYLRLPSNIFSSLARPDFGKILDPEFWSVVISLSLIGSLETLISAAAVDQLDPLKRQTDLDKDLMAIGIGTAVCGLVGGLPMIAEIVRSNANVQAGARTGWANFFHGIILLIAVLVFPVFLTNIPLTSLATLLIFTGWRLASPQKLKSMHAIGFDQLIVFVVTIAGVLSTDLLIGIAIGVAVKIGLHVLRKVHPLDLLRCRFVTEQVAPDHLKVVVLSSLVFTNVSRLTSLIENQTAAKKVTLDLSTAQMIDHTAIEKIHALKLKKAAQGVEIHAIESDRHRRVSAHAMAARRL